MSTITRKGGFRHLGVVESAYIFDEITAEIIADGCHLPPELLRYIVKFKGVDKVALVTDAMRGAGMPEGIETVLGKLDNGLPCRIERGVAWMLDGQAFAGSVATTDRLVRTMVAAGIPLVDAVKMASETPAKMAKCSTKGTLDAGKDADIVIFDESINMQHVFVRGKQIV